VGLGSGELEVNIFLGRNEENEGKGGDDEERQHDNFIVNERGFWKS